MAKKTRKAHRSAVDGQFITEKEAKKKPRESVEETVKIPTPKKKKKK